MQFELYSKESQNNGYSYHLATNDVDTVLFYILGDELEREFLIIDNYEILPIDYRLLGLKQKPTLSEHRKIVLECKIAKYIDYYIEQGISIEEINDLSISSAEKETEFYFVRLNEFTKIDY